MIQLEDSEIKKRFLLLNSIRIAALFALFLISFFLFLIDVAFSLVPVIVFIFLSMMISLLHFRVSQIANFKFSVYFQIIADILIITGLVYFSGGVSSPFYFLYFLPIIVAAMFLSRRDVIYTAAFSYINFGIVSDLMYMNVLRSYPGPFDFDISNENFIYNLIVSFIAFSFFAIISMYYFENIRKKGIELRSVRENLDDLMLINNMVLERMEDGMIVSDPEGKIISYNEKAKIYLKISENSNVLHLIGVNNAEDLRSAIFESGNRYYTEIERRKRILGISISLIKEIHAFKEVFVMLISDLTLQREIKEELKKKEHFALIGEMSAGLAHEIRNPLASISGSIQYLNKELSLNKDARNLMDIVIKESARLSNSMEEFLQFSKTAPLEKEEFDLALLLDEILKIAVINNTGVLFKKRFSQGKRIYADREKISRVIWNIINNAIKAVSGKGVVEINIYNEKSEIVLSVLDNGSGMRKEDLSRIFLPFFSNFTSGIGLGMSIVKRVLEEHGFRIHVTSELKKGTEVLIWFRKK